MVDVGGKPVTRRTATAEGRVRVAASVADAIRADRVKKGSVLEVARLAGMMAAKRTDELIPLCHSLPLDGVTVDLALHDTELRITATATCTGTTGVEMEAYTAVTVAALTVVDMTKAVDPSPVIEGVRLLEKTGGKRGHWRAEGQGGGQGGG